MPAVTEVVNKVIKKKFPKSGGDKKVHERKKLMGVTRVERDHAANWGM